MTTQTPKRTLYDRRQAFDVANDIIVRLSAYCERVQICGSLRRDRPRVHDIEILFIPNLAMRPASLFGSEVESVDMSEKLFDVLLRENYLAKRLSVKGLPAWGPKNKLAIHAASGIPVDFFGTTPDCWWNSLVVRTGGKRTNQHIAGLAIKRGFRFEAYGSGFQKIGGDLHYQTKSEEDVFRFVGLKYLEPSLRP